MMSLFLTDGRNKFSDDTNAPFVSNTIKTVVSNCQRDGEMDVENCIELALLHIVELFPCLCPDDNVRYMS